MNFTNLHKTFKPYAPIPSTFSYLGKTSVLDQITDCPVMHGLMEWYAELRRPKNLYIRAGIQRNVEPGYMWWHRRSPTCFLLGYQFETIVGGPVAYFDLEELPILRVSTAAAGIPSKYRPNYTEYLLSDPDSLTQLEHDSNNLDYVPHSDGKWYTYHVSDFGFRPAQWRTVEWRTYDY
jgi:hypothetical protein